MLPINLLPNYIFDKNKKFKMMAVWGAVLAAIAVILFMKMGSVSAELAAAKTDLDDATTKQAKYTTVDGNIKKVQSDINEIKTKQTFIANAQTYNSAWPATFELARNLTASNILLKSMSIETDHKTLQLSAFAPGNSNDAEFAIANWVKALEKNGNIVEQVNFKTPPHPFTGTAPATNGAGAASGGMGMPGSGGPMGTSGGPGMPRGMSGSSGGPMGMGGMMMPGSGGPGGAAGGAGGSDAVGYAEIEGRPGINFNMSIRLKKALAEGILTAPTWTGSNAPAAPAVGGSPLAAPAPGGAGAPGVKD